jgi:hypothetical protein
VDQLERLFLAHPRSVGESYLEHSAFAFRMALRLIAAGGAALIHAILPCLCETTASRIIMAMNSEIVTRRAQAAASHTLPGVPHSGISGAR